ncbi:hypothetical protein [Rufibacter psychrotolerans]|uniref:hypothetical protein n=1 Tax=Rufibacter psychrotolerans TaxID=2812556 RepID=UPI001966D5B6|nr:hypothetical protein [Rufibacter sp. SYSU D00308]
MFKPKDISYFGFFFMVIFIQFSLTDTRAFKGNAPELLLSPSWPLPTPNKEFVRASGQISERVNKGLNNWIGENFICKIRRGIKFNQPVKINDPVINFRVVDKHQFSSERFVITKYEFVFASKNLSHIKIDWSLLQKIIHEIINIPVSIKTTTYQYITLPLKSIKKPLKEFYILNSTKHGSFDLDLQLQNIYDCTPQIYVLLDRNESFAYTGKKYISFNDNKTYSFNLYSGWRKFNNMPTRLWIHTRNDYQPEIGIDRKLRISILRLHTEFEALKHVLKAISSDKIKVTSLTPASDFLQRYLDNAINTLLKDEKKVTAQGETDFIDDIKTIFFDFQPGEFEIIKEKILSFNFRPQIQAKTINYIEKLEIMNDKYENNGQVGAMGPNAKAENNTFNQVQYKIPANLDFDLLVTQLSQLKSEMKVKADTPEELAVVQQVALAEKEAQSKNANGVIKYLKAGGQWVIETATKIGVTVVSELLKQNLSIG